MGIGNAKTGKECASVQVVTLTGPLPEMLTVSHWEWGKVCEYRWGRELHDATICLLVYIGSGMARDHPPR